MELLGLRENMELNNTELRWVSSGAMLADAMTKKGIGYELMDFLRFARWKIVFDNAFTSEKKRKA